MTTKNIKHDMYSTRSHLTLATDTHVSNYTNFILIWDKKYERFKKCYDDQNDVNTIRSNQYHAPPTEKRIHTSPSKKNPPKKTNHTIMSKQIVLKPIPDPLRSLTSSIFESILDWRIVWCDRNCDPSDQDQPMTGSHPNRKPWSESYDCLKRFDLNSISISNQLASHAHSDILQALLNPKSRS